MSEQTRNSGNEPLPSGQQWTIRHGDDEAVVVEIGGGLRSYARGGRPVLFGYAADAMADAARGHVLVPWPNRIAGGRYSFGGQDAVLPLTEPARGNASHGLVHWMPWSLVTQSDSSLTVGVTLHPQPGWRWTMRVEMTYSLDGDGLTVTPRVTNLSATPCPFGFGMHPYLTVGEESLDEVTLTARATREIEVDEALIPTGEKAASLPPSGELPLRDVRLDTCFTGLAADDDGRWRVGVSAGGRTTTLWADAKAFGYVQMFTGDSLHEARRRRSGLAVEPMTCPADAFNSGKGLLTLAPGEQWSASFGVTTD